MRSGLGSVIQHPDIKSHRPELYTRDGIHLSELGMGLFLEDLQGALRTEIFSLGGGLGAYKSPQAMASSVKKKVALSSWLAWGAKN